MMLIIGLIILLLVAVYLTNFYRGKALKFQTLFEEEKSKKMSLSVNHGKTIEKFIPWINKVFPYDPSQFRFIGDPIDGIVFNEDEIVFTEFKTGSSRLSGKQKNIKNIVKNGKISWKEIRLE